MAKKKRRKAQQFPKDNKITYNKYKPNRQARRLGVVAEELQREEPKKETVAAVMSRKIQRVKELEKKIVPQGMTYGQYTGYLKDKKQQLEAKIVTGGKGYESNS